MGNAEYMGGRGQEHSQPLLCLVCQRPGRRRTRAGRISVRVLCCHGRRLDVAGCCRRDFEAVVCQCLDPQFPFTGTERREQRSEAELRAAKWTPSTVDATVDAKNKCSAAQKKKSTKKKKKKKKKKNS